MKSIRQKLFLQIGSLMLLFILLIFVANTFFLETYYINNTKNDLLRTYETINALAVGDYESNILYQLSIGSKTNMEILIENENTGDVYTPQSPLLRRRAGSMQPNPNRPQKGPFEKRVTDVVDENVSFTQVLDRENNNTFISLEGVLDNGNTLIISVPVTSIEQNVRIMNIFILIVGAVVFLLSLVAAGVLSRHFTKPIVNINEVTKKITNLDFDHQCDVMTTDEIGQLAENINDMSRTLKNNINDLAVSNEQLKEEVDERLKIDEQRKALLNNVSHELKTPLSMVQGYSEGLKLYLDKDRDKTEFYCDVINDEAKKMDRLVSQLLEINHMQSGDVSLRKEHSSASEFIDYILKKYETVFEHNDIDFKNGSPFIDEGLVLDIDLLRSEQILTNLLNNAIAYVDDRKEIMFRTKETPDHLLIEVINSCGEIPETELERLWGSFYKLDKARTRSNGGYGLGLSIIKAIQEADDNDFGVHQKNGYITFWVAFDKV